MYEDEETLFKSIELKNKKSRFKKEKKNFFSLLIYIIIILLILYLVYRVLPLFKKENKEISKELISTEKLNKIEENIKKDEIKKEETKNNNLKDDDDEDDLIYTVTYNYINILISFDEQGLYPALVTITSILENRAKTTFVNIHCMIPDSFSNEGKIKIKSVYQKYKNLELIFYNVGNMFDEFNSVNDLVTRPSFYLLGAPYIIKNVDLFIYLDIDVIVLEDLYEMYTLNMNNLYFRGILEHNIVQKGAFDNIKVDPYINTGVMLMNAKKLREEIILNTYLYYHQRHKTSFNSQSIINDVCFPFLDLLPPKYGLLIRDNQEIKKFADFLKDKTYKYYLNELEEGKKHLAIYHFTGKNKPWTGDKENLQLWKVYAEKTLYYQEIKKKYNF